MCTECIGEKNLELQAFMYSVTTFPENGHFVTIITP